MGVTFIGVLGSACASSNRNHGIREMIRSLRVNFSISKIVRQLFNGMKGISMGHLEGIASRRFSCGQEAPAVKGGSLQFLYPLCAPGCWPPSAALVVVWAGMGLSSRTSPDPFCHHNSFSYSNLK